MTQPVEPPRPSYDPPGHDAAGYAAPGSAPALPGLATTILVTFFFGPFGLIPAGRGARRARATGRPGERYWVACAAAFAGSVLLYALVAVTTVLVVLRSPEPAPAAGAVAAGPSASASPIRLSAQRLSQGSFYRICSSTPTSPLSAWGVPTRWEDPTGTGAPPTGPRLDSFGGYACQIHTQGVILQLEVLDLNSPDIRWPPPADGPGSRTTPLGGVADQAWVTTAPGTHVTVQVAATSGDVGVTMLVLSRKGWSPADVDATARQFTEQVKATIATLATLEK